MLAPHLISLFKIPPDWFNSLSEVLIKKFNHFKIRYYTYSENAYSRIVSMKSPTKTRLKVRIKGFGFEIYKSGIFRTETLGNMVKYVFFLIKK